MSLISHRLKRSAVSGGVMFFFFDDKAEAESGAALAKPRHGAALAPGRSLCGGVGRGADALEWPVTCASYGRDRVRHRHRTT